MCCTAAADASAYVCNDPDTLSVETSALATATEIATATATAIASVVAECEAGAVLPLLPPPLLLAVPAW